ncbi:hypothetical protein [Rhodococcus sp. NPDC057529]|uniref:hypothetical protein n=1 Tax=Rhodococcus sp. NPDC057529 TaxID=3346158 RepID=UPI00366E0B7D
MTVDDFEANQIDTLLRSITFAEADALRRPCPTARNFLDSMLHDLCMQPLGEATERRALLAFRRFAELFDHDPDGFREHIPVAITPVLEAAVSGWTEDNVGDRVRSILTALGGPSSTEREHALTLYARVIAARVRDGYVHPYLAATHLAWPDIHDWDNLAKPEIAAMRVGARVKYQWPQFRPNRGVLEQDLLSALEGITWPSPHTAPQPAQPIEWADDEYTTALGRAVYAVAALESYILFELLHLPGAPIDVTELGGRPSRPTAEIGEVLAQPELLDTVSDVHVRYWLSAAGAALKETAMARDELLHSRPAVEKGVRMLHGYAFSPSGKAYLNPLPQHRVERLATTAVAHRTHLARLRTHVADVSTS